MIYSIWIPDISLFVLTFLSVNLCSIISLRASVVARMNLFLKVDKFISEVLVLFRDVLVLIIKLIIRM